jgi:glucokinase
MGKVGDVKVIGAIDIGGTKIAVAAVTAEGKILSRQQCPTEPEKGFGDAMRRIKGMLLRVAEGEKLDGIGIACPGPLDPLTGTIYEVGTLPGWNNNNLFDELKDEFKIPVALENDADAAALAEATLGSAKNLTCFIYVTVSTGIGGGIIISGEIYRGVGGAHPELGHQIIDASGPRCYCNSRGCWESLASGAAMVAWMRERLPDETPMTAQQICALAQRGDNLARLAVEREGYYLGLGLANLITLFAPSSIALGGGVMKDSHLFLNRALNVVREVCTQVPVSKTQISIASLGADVGLLGAAQAWFSRYR